MGRIAWKGKNCCVENASTPSSFDVDVLRSEFAARRRFACSRCSHVQARGSRLRSPTRPNCGICFLDPLFVFEIVWNVLFTSARKTLKKVKVVVFLALNLHSASPENTHREPGPGVFVPIIFFCPVNAIHTARFSNNNPKRKRKRESKKCPRMEKAMRLIGNLETTGRCSHFTPHSPTQDLAMRELGRLSPTMKSSKVRCALGKLCRLSRRCDVLDTCCDLSLGSLLLMFDELGL